MQKRIFLFLIVFSALELSAKCGYGRLSVLPSGTNVSQKGIFILEQNGYSPKKELFTNEYLSKAVCLKSDSHLVFMDILEINKGEFNTIQAILKPKEKLKVGQKYEMIITNGEKPMKYSPLNFTESKAEWWVNQDIDTLAPSWIKKPQLYRKQLAHYGCGPVEFVDFKFSINDTNPLFIKVDRKAIFNNTNLSYWFEVNSDSIRIGHGMCNGAFNYQEDEEYDIQFMLFDLSGNSDSRTASKIHFTGPEDLHQLLNDNYYFKKDTVNNIIYWSEGAGTGGGYSGRGPSISTKNKFTLSKEQELLSHVTENTIMGGCIFEYTKFVIRKYKNDELTYYILWKKKYKNAKVKTWDEVSKTWKTEEISYEKMLEIYEKFGM